MKYVTKLLIGAGLIAGAVVLKKKSPGPIHGTAHQVQVVGNNPQMAGWTVSYDAAAFPDFPWGYRIDIMQGVWESGRAETKKEVFEALDATLEVNGYKRN